MHIESPRARSSSMSSTLARLAACGRGSRMLKPLPRTYQPGTAPADLGSEGQRKRAQHGVEGVDPLPSSADHAESRILKSSMLPDDNLRLLLVDDDPAIIRAYGAVLTRHGVTVETASDGKAASERVKAG